MQVDQRNAKENVCEGKLKRRPELKDTPESSWRKPNHWWILVVLNLSL